MKGQSVSPHLASGERIHLYGWDSRSEIWHGPTELRGNGADRRLLRALQAVAGKSWYGTVNYRVAGFPAVRFFALVHGLADCACAQIYCGESKAGPAELLAVIPGSRRPHLREEFAFEFLAFARFLGAVRAGAELQAYDAINSAIAEHQSGPLVFSISSGSWPSDLEHCLSLCVERTALTLCQLSMVRGIGCALSLVVSSTTTGRGRPIEPKFSIVWSVVGLCDSTCI